MECSTSYASGKSTFFQTSKFCQMPHGGVRPLRKEKRASKLLRQAVVRAMSGEPAISGDSLACSVIETKERLT